jgi:uracil DNA glycosylase
MGKIYSKNFFSNFLLIINLKFQDAIVQYLNDRSANIVFLLWGRDAQNKGARIDKVILMII